MKIAIVRFPWLVAALPMVVVCATTNALGDKYKANNSVPLNYATSWTNNGVPTSAELGIWSSLVTQLYTTNSLGANLTWGGIKILDPGGPIWFTTGNTITLLGVSGTGIDMSAALQDLTVNCVVSLPTSQKWTIAAGRTMTMAGTLSGPGSLTKDGAGTLALSGAINSTGNPIVNGGTLVVNGSMAAASTLTVRAGAILGGIGLIGAAVTVQTDAVLSPGMGGIGTLTVSNSVTFSGTTLMDINRTNALNSDRVTGMSTLFYGGILAINNLGPAPQAGDSFTLFTATNYIGGFASILPVMPGEGLIWDASRLTVDGTLRIARAKPPCVTYAGLEHCGLGSATLTLESNELTVANLGSSGQDGVSIAMPADFGSWGALWLPLDADGTLPVGAWLRVQMVGTWGLVTNGVWGTLTTTKAGISNFIFAMDFSLVGASNVMVEAYDGTHQTARFSQPCVDIPGYGDHPDDYEINGYGAVIWTFDPRRWFRPKVGEPVLADRVMFTPNGVSGPVSVSAVQITGSQIGQMTFTRESLAPRPAPLQFIPTTGGLNLSWPSSWGWVLQHAGDITGPWNDLSTSNNSYRVVPTGTAQFYRLSYPAP